MLGIISCCQLPSFVFKMRFSKQLFQDQSFGVSDGLDPDKNRCSFVQTVYRCGKQTTKVAATCTCSRQKVNACYPFRMKAISASWFCPSLMTFTLDSFLDFVVYFSGIVIFHHDDQGFCCFDSSKSNMFQSCRDMSSTKQRIQGFTKGDNVHVVTPMAVRFGEKPSLPTN